MLYVTTFCDFFITFLIFQNFGLKSLVFFNYYSAECRAMEMLQHYNNFKKIMVSNQYYEKNEKIAKCSDIKRMHSVATKKKLSKNIENASLQVAHKFYT